MITLKVRTNFPEVRRSLERLKDDIGNRATVAALNKTVDKGRTEMVRGITDEFALKAGDVRPKLSVGRASNKPGGAEVVLEAFPSRRGKRSANVILFAERKVTLAEGRRRARAGTQRNVFVQIRKGQARKMIARSWIMTSNGGTFVAQRTGSGKGDIRSVRTGDIPQWFQTKRINRRVVARTEKEFPVEFERAAAYFVERFNRA